MLDKYVNKVSSGLIVSPLLFLVACSSHSNDVHQKLLADATRQTSTELIKSKVKIKSVDTNNATIIWNPTKEVTYIKRTVYKEKSNRFVFIPNHAWGFSSITSYLSNEVK
jgi:hypothetical protein